MKKSIIPRAETAECGSYGLFLIRSFVERCNLLTYIMEGGFRHFFLGKNLSHNKSSVESKEVHLCTSIYFLRDHDFWLL